MSYLLLGGSGHTSKVAAEKLLAAGKDLTVSGRSAENLKPLTDKGAKAAIGSLEDAAFVKEAFKNKTAVYALIPPNFSVADFAAYQKKVARNIIDALKESNVKHLVFLSSIGAHLGKGAGVIDGLAYFEELLKAEIPDIAAKILRPGFFYYNFFSQIPIIKTAGIIGSNYEADLKIPLVDPADIGAVVAQELLNLNFTGISVRYIASEELTQQEAAGVLGKAIGKPDLQWVRFSDEQVKAGLLQAGLKEDIANGYIEMGHAFQSGKGQEDYFNHQPELGPGKLSEFAKVFAGAYSAS